MKSTSKLTRAVIAVLAVLMLVPSMQAQHGTIKGTVKSGNQPIAGATVDVLNSSDHASTDQHGQYTLTTPIGFADLVASAPGYESDTVKSVQINNTTLTVDFELAVVKPEPIQELVIVEVEEEAVYYDMATQLNVVGSRKMNMNAAGAYYAAPMGDSQRLAFSTMADDRETYEKAPEIGYQDPVNEPLSTFSIDVDKAAYANCRRFINRGQLPPQDAVRVEEFINYFQYDYPKPLKDDPFSVTTSLSPCPWNRDYKIAHIGIKGREIDMESAPASNLVFLLDVSGSMNYGPKLPLVKKSLMMLADQLREQDKVSIVVYAGAAGIVLDGSHSKTEIANALEGLSAGGSTAGGAGIQLAYATARKHLLTEGNNRVILCTDGDFNVGVSSDDALVKLIEKERESGVFLTVMGFGSGNIQDAKMEKLADKGNGSYYYIDNLLEARKNMVEEMGGTLYTIAKDVKIQVEFNPAHVQAYRLIGYENRMLEAQDFNDDTKDAGEIGSGHTVTALYEIIPVGVKMPGNVDPLKYQKTEEVMRPSGDHSDEWMTVKLRYKQPDGDTSQLLTHVVRENSVMHSMDAQFAMAVAQFGMILSESKYCKTCELDNVLALAKAARGRDVNGYRAEFIRLVEAYKSLI